MGVDVAGAGMCLFDRPEGYGIGAARFHRAAAIYCVLLSYCEFVP
jgi:hypothetical protein